VQLSQVIAEIYNDIITTRHNKAVYSIFQYFTTVDLATQIIMEG